MKTGLRRLGEPAVAATLGALQTLAFVHTSWAWWLPVLTLAWLAWRLDLATPRRAAVLGWCYGAAWVAAAVWWLFISMHTYGGLAAPLAVTAVAALAAVLSLYVAGACAAYARWRGGGARDPLLFAAVWLLAELARGVLFTGFPGAALGYSQVDAPLAGWAPWLGVYGVGAAVAFTSAALLRALTSHGRQWGPAVAAVVVLGLGQWAPRGFSAPAGEINVVLLQANVSQDEKFSAERMPETLEWIGQSLLAAQADLVVAPETAVPLLPFQLEEVAPGYWESLRAHFSWPERAALVGVPLGTFETGYTNSVIGMSAAPEYRYDKTHLVPFGEFIPAGFRWFTQMMNIPLGDFARGVANPPSFPVLTQRVAPNICYEDLFGEELARRFADAATAPTIFANVSNIGWFGDTIAIAQHLNISRMRALEFQRPMLRATNTGATAVIDHQGRVTANLPSYTRGSLAATVQGRTGLTPFAAWASRMGLWPLFVAALALLLWCALRRPSPGSA